MGQTEYLVVVEKYGPGSYGAYVPKLPGIGVAGETESDVRDAQSGAANTASTSAANPASNGDVAASPRANVPCST